MPLQVTRGAAAPSAAPNIPLDPAAAEGLPAKAKAPSGRGRRVVIDHEFKLKAAEPATVNRHNRHEPGSIAAFSRWVKRPDTAAQLGAKVGYFYHLNTEAALHDDTRVMDFSGEVGAAAIAAGDKTRTMGATAGNVSRGPIRVCGSLLYGGETIYIGVCRKSKAIFLAGHGTVSRAVTGAGFLELNTPAPNLALLYVPRGRNGGSITDANGKKLPRGPLHPHYKQAVAYCESVVQFVADAMQQPTAMKPPAVDALREGLETAVREAQRRARDHGVGKRRDAFVQATFGPNVTWSRFVKGRPTFFQVMKLAVVMGMDALRLKGSSDDMTSVELLALAAVAEGGVVVSQTSLLNIYNEFQMTCMRLNSPNLAMYGAAAGWPTCLTDLLHGLQVATARAAKKKL